MKAVSQLAVNPQVDIVPGWIVITDVRAAKENDAIIDSGKFGM